MDQLTENIATAAQQLEQLVQETRQRRNGQVGLSASPARTAALQLMRQKVHVDAHRPIAWPYWPPGLWDKVVALGQKVTRRLLRWYIVPLVQQQNQFNLATLNTLQLLADEVSALRSAYLNDRAEQQDRLIVLTEQIEALRQSLPLKDL